MAEIVRLQTRPDRVKRETAAEIRQLILAYPEQDGVTTRFVQNRTVRIPLLEREENAIYFEW
jgi:hypothetical protein